MSVYSPDAVDRCVDLKLEGTAVAEKTLHVNGAGWQTLTFDYSDVFSSTANYYKASLMPNIGGEGCSWGGGKSQTIWYFDNISFPGATKADVVIPRTAPSGLVNFEANDTTGYTAGGSADFGGTIGSKVSDAPAGGSVGSTSALKLENLVNAASWSGETFLTLGAKASVVSEGHTTITANVYAPAAGKDMMMKIQSAVTGAFIEKHATSVQGWQTVSYDFTGYNAAMDYNMLIFFPDFNGNDIPKTASTWYIDDIAFNGATSAALDTNAGSGGNTGGGTPVPFTGHATVRLAGMDATNSVDHQADADYWVSQGWARGGATYHTKLVPVGSTQHLTYVVSDSANGSPVANATVTLVLGKAYADSTAKLHVGAAVAGGAGTECWCGNPQATVTGVTNAQGLVSFDVVNDNVAADAADYPGTNLAVAPTGKKLFSQITAYVTSVLEDSVDVVDFYYHAPATVVAAPQVVSRVNGITADNTAAGSTEGWAQYYAAGLQFFERGVEVGTTTHLSYTVTANGEPYANKTVHLLLGKQYSGSTAKVSVNGRAYTGAEVVIDLTTDANGVVSFDVANTDVAADADPYQAANVLHPATGKHLFAQLALVGEKGNQDVLDILDLVYYRNQAATPPTVMNVRLADWNANNSFDGTHVWGDGGLGSWFDATTGYFAHYVKAGSTFNLRYSVKTAAGVAAPNGTVVTLALGSAWSGSNAKFTVNGVAVSGLTKWGANGQLDQATTTAVVSGGYITVPMTALDLVEDATPNPGSATANPDTLNPLFMQVKAHVEGNYVTQQDWINLVVTQPQAAPTITSISGTSGKNGQAIDIVGTNFGDALGDTTVSLFTPATTKTAAVTTPVSVISVSADGTRMTVRSPNKTQKGNLKITTTAGTATAASAFSASTSVTSKAAITFPASLVKEVGSTLTLTGANLGSSTVVKIGAVTVPFTVLSATSIAVVIPETVVSGSTISATNAGGTVTTTKLVFQAPVITTATSSGKVGATVTVTGKNLKATAIVFGGNKTAKAITNDGNTLTFLVPTGATTGAIKITTGGGVVYTNSFTVVPPAPTVTSFTPATGKKGVAIITVKGTNLLGATVTVGSVAVTLSAGATATSFKFVIPAGAATGKINVTTAGGTASSAASLTVTN
jgi:ribosomal protein L7Ae-like RNA K-turn-binding protein